MPPKPLIQVPDTTRGRPTVGLVLRKSKGYLGGAKYFAAYTVDGSPKLKSLRTLDPGDAIRRRDDFYNELKAAGATVAGPVGRPGA